MVPVFLLGGLALLFFLGKKKKKDAGLYAAGPELAQQHPELHAAYVGCLMQPGSCPQSSAAQIAAELQQFGFYYEAGQLRQALGQNAFPVA